MQSPCPRPSTRLEEAEQQPLVACRCKESYWRAVAVDALLEVAALREQLDLDLRDRAEWIARARHRLYTMVGGTERTIGSYRAEVLDELRRGGDGFGGPVALSGRGAPGPVEEVA